MPSILAYPITSLGEGGYLNWVSARMNGSFRFMVVPILSDWMGPFPVDSRDIPQPIISGIPHSDGALFSDTSGYSQAGVDKLVKPELGELSRRQHPAQYDQQREHRDTRSNRVRRSIFAGFVDRYRAGGRHLLLLDQVR